MCDLITSYLDVCNSANCLRELLRRQKQNRIEMDADRKKKRLAFEKIIGYKTKRHKRNDTRLWGDFTAQQGYCNDCWYELEARRLMDLHDAAQFNRKHQHLLQGRRSKTMSCLVSIGDVVLAAAVALGASCVIVEFLIGFFPALFGMGGK
jgi:hypothetical protein